MGFNPSGYTYCLIYSLGRGHCTPSLASVNWCEVAAVKIVNNMTKLEAIDLCRKINELVKRGIDGEKASAQSRLKILMNKHGIKAHDIEGERIIEGNLICTEDERRFAAQVVASVLGNNFKDGKYRKRYYFDAPESKIAEIKDRWAHYKNLWKEEEEIFYSAFVQKHKLYAKPSNEAEPAEEPKPLSPEEQAKLKRMFQMMEGMEYSDYKKKLTK